MRPTPVTVPRNLPHRLHHRKYARTGFTLIELLVVIAIIAVLAAILFPVFSQARDKARQTACLSNMKQLGIALMQYVQDYDETYPGNLQLEPNSYNPSSLPNNGGRKPFDMQLMPYIKSDGIFTCPSDALGYRVSATAPGSAQNGYALTFWDETYRARGIPRSYAYVGPVNTIQGGSSDPNTGVSTYPGTAGTGRGKAMSDVDATSETIVFAEVWMKKISTTNDSSYVGSSHGSGLVGCDTWKLAGRMPGVSVGTDSLPSTCSSKLNQLPTPGHAGGETYVFADGSARWLPWGKVRENDFYLFKLRKPGQTVSP